MIKLKLSYKILGQNPSKLGMKCKHNFWKNSSHPTEQILSKDKSTFTQKPRETLYQCWGRFKELLNIFPHHNFETWRLVSYFYNGLQSQSRQVEEMMCNGKFSDKSPEDALNYLDYIAENAQHCDTIGFYESSCKPQSSPFSGGIHNLREDYDLQAKFASLTKKVEALELKKNNHVKFVQNISCYVWDSTDHSTQDCPTLPTLRESLQEQVNVVDNFKRKNPNFSLSLHDALPI